MSTFWVLQDLDRPCAKVFPVKFYPCSLVSTATYMHYAEKSKEKDLNQTKAYTPMSLSIFLTIGLTWYWFVN